MLARRRLVLALVAAVSSLPSMGASFRTTNFVVQAPTPQLAQQFGQWAEHYRREKAQLWLGREMPTWPQPCPLYVQVTMDSPSGATSFNFGQDQGGRGAVMGMKMEIQGPLDRLLHSVLPHEITHTVFAHYFGCPLPRWADEGGSVLSEDDVERERHDKLVRGILNQGQQIRLRTLLPMKEYPRNVMCLYAEGYSVTDYLIKRSNRQTFLQFIGHGMRYGWDSAVRTYYHHNSVEELEEAWLKQLRDTRGQPHIQLAQGRQQGPAPADPAARTLVRLTVPPVQPLQPVPVVRGQAPDEAPHGYLPPSLPGSPPGGAPPAPMPVQLGPPQFDSRPAPTWSSPAGFPQ